MSFSEHSLQPATAAQEPPHATDESRHHTHLWQTRSTHLVLEGLLRYQYCTCGRWRIVTAAEFDEEFTVDVVLND